MINTLIDDIKNYAEYLKDEGMYISVHTDFTEYMLDMIDLNIHKNPKCLLVKSEDENWKKCISVHNTEMYEGANMKKRVCPYGVLEYVFFLNCGGTVCVSGEDKLDEEKTARLINPFCRMIEYLKTLFPKEEEVSNNETVNRAVKFIQRNFYNKITNEDIARVCSCSVSALCHLFKEYKGESVHRYIMELRISYAKELLTGSNLSVLRVAEKSGFSDYNCFSVRFKKQTRMTPREYRKKTH